MLESDPDSAARTARYHLSLPARSQSKLERGTWYEVLAHASLKRVDLLQALVYCDSAFRYLDHQVDSLAAGRLLLIRGEILSRAGDFTTASEHLESALTIFTVLKDPGLMASARRALGWLHYHQRQFAPAMEHYWAAVRLFRQERDEAGVARTYGNMGVLAGEDNDTNDYANAFAYYDTSMVIARAIADRAQMSKMFGNIGLLYMYLDRVEEARSHFDSALVFAEAERDSVLIGYARENIGELGLHTNDCMQAKRDCGWTFTFAKRRGLISLQRDAMMCMLNAHRTCGEWKAAFDATWRYFELRDETYNASSREEILRRSLVSEADRRRVADSTAHAATVQRLATERTIAHMRADRNRDRAVRFGLVVVVLFAGGTAYYLNDRMRRQARADRHAVELEINALRAQMNPHFLFNALNSIHDHMLEHQPEEAADFLARFSKLMRQVLESSRLNEVTLARELDILNGYIELERMRLHGKFKVVMDVAQDVDQQTAMVPPLILQPFVENAIWHGLSRKDGLGQLRIEVSQQDHLLLVAIEDDGIGRENPADSAQPEGRTSLGTTITRHRLDLLAKQRGTHAGFTFVPVAQGTRVELVLPQAT